MCVQQVKLALFSMKAFLDLLQLVANSRHCPDLAIATIMQLDQAANRVTNHSSQLLLASVKQEEAHIIRYFR